jgi:hypothetical protein
MVMLNHNQAKKIHYYSKVRTFLVGFGGMQTCLPPLLGLTSFAHYGSLNGCSI